jgi:hypothetical protein
MTTRQHALLGAPSGSIGRQVAKERQRQKAAATYGSRALELAAVATSRANQQQYQPRFFPTSIPIAVNPT